MRKAFGLVLTLLACSGEREYDNNDAELAVGYAAKDFCSCLFVSGQTEAYCHAWTKASPQVARVRIDHSQKAVEASAILMWGARSRFVSERDGCVLE